MLGSYLSRLSFERYSWKEKVVASYLYGMMPDCHIDTLKAAVAAALPARSLDERDERRGWG